MRSQVQLITWARINFWSKWKADQNFSSSFIVLLMLWLLSQHIMRRLNWLTFMPFRPAHLYSTHTTSLQQANFPSLLLIAASLYFSELVWFILEVACLKNANVMFYMLMVAITIAVLIILMWIIWIIIIVIKSSLVNGYEKRKVSSERN